MRRSVMLEMLCVAALAAMLLAGCGGGNGTGPGVPAGGESGLAPIETMATGEAPVIIGFNAPPGAAEEALVETAGGTVTRVFHLIPAIAATVPEAAIAELSADPSVAYVEGDPEMRVPKEDVAPSDADLTADLMETMSTSDDALSWGPDRIDADVVWGCYEMVSIVDSEVMPPSDYGIDVHSEGLTGAGVKVAVIDSGIDYTHPDLAPNYRGGYDFYSDDDDPMDGHGHGTRCSGIIAAADNDAGVIGVAPEVDLYALRVMTWSIGKTGTVIAALEWCVDNGIQVASISLSGTGSKSLEAACDAAYEANLLIVTSAGNNGTANGGGNKLEAPATYDSVIAVAATKPADVRASFSSTGPDVELAAPGRRIYTTDLGGSFWWFDGTSASAPHAAAAAALLIESGITSAPEVRARLQQTAVDLGDPGRDWWYGFGRIDVATATGAVAQNDETGDLMGVVVEATNGKPLDYATVTVVDTEYSCAVFPAREGNFLVQDMPPGTYTVTCESAGYSTGTATAEIPPDQSTWLEFEMSSK